MRKIFFLSLILVAFQLSFTTVDSANIVFFVGFSSYSHRVPMWPLAEALAEKGHNVTFICPYLDKNPNPKIFDYAPQGLKDWTLVFDEDYDIFEDRRNGRWLTNGWFSCPDLGISMCEYVYRDQEFMRWVKSAEVDLVIIDALFNDCAYGWAHHWGAKQIIFHTSSAYSWFIDSFGLPSETNWLPNKELVYSPDMTLPQRIANTLMPVVWDYYRKWYYFPKLEKLTRDNLPLTDKLPSFEELEWNTSMIFINTHYGEDFPRSLPPHTINVGGIAWTGGKAKPLPKKLEQFLGNGEADFIYVSFGTLANFTKLDKPVQEAFFGAINSFPNLKFVWKYDDESILKKFPNKNVYLSKWMPQQQILAHPNIKGFITHSGLLGIQEAVRNAVPLICFPIFADQDYNAERVHRKEYGIQLEVLSVTQSELEDAINKLVNDPKYRNNMKKVSNLFNERPQEPLETGLWWTEFVLKHSHEELTALRPLGVSQPWWKKRGVDVWATVLGIALILSYTLLLIIWKILRKLCFGGPVKSSSLSKSSNGSVKTNNKLKKKKFL